MLMFKMYFSSNQNLKKNKGNTPAHYAKSYEFSDMLDLLLAAQAEEGIRNAKGHTIWEGAFNNMELKDLDMSNE